MSFLINPYAFLAAGGDFESIATVTVGSGGASSIEFTNIGTDWQHLQIRGVHQVNANDRTLGLQFNSDTGSNYAQHSLSGNGTSASASGSASQARIEIAYNLGSGYSSSYLVACVIDILDYASTSKATTVRTFYGVDYNGSGRVHLVSGLWTSTNAVTSLKLTPFSSGTVVQHSTYALYGIKAP